MYTSPRHQKQTPLQTRTRLIARVGSQLRSLVRPSLHSRKRLIGLSIFTGLGVSTAAFAANEAQHAIPSLDTPPTTTTHQEATPSDQNDEGVSTGSESSSSVTEVKTDVTNTDADAAVTSTVKVDGQPVTVNNPSHQTIVTEGSHSSVSVNVSVDSSSSSDSNSSSSTDISVSSTNNQGDQAIRGSPRR